MASFQLFFSVQGTGGSVMGPDPENSVGDQATGSTGRRVPQSDSFISHDSHNEQYCFCNSLYRLVSLRGMQCLLWSSYT